MLRPLLHFLWIGSLLFALDRLWLASPPRPEPVVVPAQRTRELSEAFLSQTGRPPSEPELLRLLHAEVDDELLYREALALRFDRDDPVVQRRLLENMRFAGADPEREPESLLEEAFSLGMQRSDPVVRRRLIQRMRLVIESQAHGEEPSEPQLRAHYEADPGRYTDPPRARLLQLFFDGEPPGEVPRALAQLTEAGPDAGAVARLGDPFLHATRQPLQSQSELASRFGAEFAASVLALPIDRWSGPIASSYGEHLVYVQERVPEALRSFESAREELRFALLAERRDELLAQALTRLREGVEVVVEDARP